MNKENFDKKVITIISKVLKVSTKSVKSSSVARDFETWDSLNNIKIFLEIQKIKKKINISDYSKCKKVGDIFNID